MAYSLAEISDDVEGISLGQEKNEIDNESIEINKLFAAARDGLWFIVWEILGPPERPRKDYLINVIPESRRWGILHHAVYWHDVTTLKKVLSYKTCDYNIPTKPCTFENGEVDSKSPIEIAKMYFFSEATRILSESSQSLINQGLATFQGVSRPGETRGLQLLEITMAAYKRAFHPGPIDPNKSLFEVMKDIFNDVNTSDERWVAIKEKVCEATDGVCENTHADINSRTTREGFYGAMIYNTQESFLYTFIITAMRRQKKADYRPTARDLALGPYILMYQILLLFWGNLKKEPGKTYRRMLVSEADLDRYKVGTKFMWVSFVSSSPKVENAVAFPTCELSGDNVIIFTIDNSTPSIWQPRNIEKYAKYIDYERTYPAGAHFQITNRKQKNDGFFYIDMKLLKG